MKPQTGAYLDSSRELLAQAKTMLRVALTDAAGRTAYHAAQALICEREDRVLKTHRGVQSEFARLAKDDPSFDVALRAFLGRAYSLKATADYEAGAGSKVTQVQAQDAVDDAHRFVEAVTALVSRPATGGTP